MFINNVSQTGLDFIRTFEGAYLSSDIINKLEKEVSDLITAPLNQNQFDALFSFASNMGIERLANSFLLKRINELEDPCIVATEELFKLNKEKNKVYLEEGLPNLSFFVINLQNLNGVGFLLHLNAIVF